MHEHVARLREDDYRPGRDIPALARQFAAGRLTWWPQLGIGYYPVETGLEPYDQDYFDAFASNADTYLGRALMAARVALVEYYYQGPLIDIGIGSGAFIDARPDMTFGYDVNPCGIDWLKERRLLADPYAAPFEAATMWDVLEHMPDYPALLANVRQWLFLSLPIFRDADHVLRSKHYKPKEHCWYFTSEGLVFAMQRCGFALVEESRIETELGREDIGSFAFKRIRDA
jgi:Methyltransferase domain